MATCSALAPPTQGRPTLPTSVPLRRRWPCSALDRLHLPQPSPSRKPACSGCQAKSMHPHPPTPTQACPSPEHPCLSERSREDLAHSHASLPGTMLTPRGQPLSPHRPSSSLPLRPSVLQLKTQLCRVTICSHTAQQTRSDRWRLISQS